MQHIAFVLHSFFIDLQTHPAIGLRHLFFASQLARFFLAVVADLWHLYCAHRFSTTYHHLLALSHASRSPLRPFHSIGPTLTTEHPLCAHTLSDGGFDQLTRRGLEQTAELAHALLRTVGAGGNETFATEIEVRCIGFSSPRLSSSYTAAI
jgi:hypothetical protein